MNSLENSWASCCVVVSMPSEEMKLVGFTQLTKYLTVIQPTLK